MRKFLSGLFALALVTGLAAGCTDSGQSGRVGENPSSERMPAASPPTSPSDSGSTLGSSPSSSPSPGSTEAPKNMPASPPTR